ncbi:MAG: DUF975 family protein [Firmicutes bacterium]|nr:DUF975 family protein [Bacillota bacterium]
MFNRKELKERAKLVLLRSYSRVFLACLAVNLLSGGGIGISTKKLRSIDFSAMPPQKMVVVFAILITLSVITIALSIFVISPLGVGLKKFMTENAKSDAALDLLLMPFGENYKNIVIVQFVKNIFVFLWSLPAIIPTVIMGFFIGDIENLAEAVNRGSALDSAKLLMIVFLWLLFTLIFAIPSIIKELQYVLVPYILADNPQTEWKSAISKSKEMMVGNKWAYVKLIFSFALWYLAANLLCCIGGFLVMPYVEATVCEMYLELAGKTPVNAGYE